MKKGLTFDDIALVPRRNSIDSRLKVKVDSYAAKNCPIGIPILNSPMESVISPKLAEVLDSYGTFPILHRFCDLKKELEKYRKNMPLFISCSGKLTIEELTKLLKLQRLYNIIGVCVDTANGHTDYVIQTIKNLRDAFGPLFYIMAGAVCTAEGTKDLIEAGADSIRVGIGNGSNCSTRIVTGFGVPQFTAIQECAKIAKEYDVVVIAEGGIRNSRDMVLALAGGASAIMLGRQFAATEESGAKKQLKKDGMSARYRGQASLEFQSLYLGGVKIGTVPEGVSTWIKVTGSARGVIDYLVGALRSALTYAGASSIKELQVNAEFIEVTSAYMLESMPKIY